MPAVCGLACEVCLFKDHGQCLCGGSDGCVAGTDPRAKEKLQEFNDKLGFPCQVLNCAIWKGVDYCFRCNEFPCTTHKGYIYNESFLAWVKANKPKKQ